MLRQLVCYRRFFPFYLRTPSQSLLSWTSASQFLILLVTGEVRTFVTMCFVVRSSICIFCIIAYFWTFFTTCFVARSCICIFCSLQICIPHICIFLDIFHFKFCRQIFYLHILRSHVVDLCLEFPPWGSMKGISGNDVSYRGTFLLQRYFSVTEVFSRI